MALKMHQVLLRMAAILGFRIYLYMLVIGSVAWIALQTQL